jgi:chaperonin GroES
MNLDNLKPLGDRILVKKIHEEDKFIGSIFIPNKEKFKIMQAQILAFGKGVKMSDGSFRPYDPLLKVGQKILTGKYANVGGEIKGHDGHLVITEADIFGVIED